MWERTMGTDIIIVKVSVIVYVIVDFLWCHARDIITKILMLISEILTIRIFLISIKNLLASIVMCFVRFSSKNMLIVIYGKHLTLPTLLTLIVSVGSVGSVGCFFVYLHIIRAREGRGYRMMTLRACLVPSL